MCMQATAVRRYQRWRRAGDEVVREPVGPASRVEPGVKKTRCPIAIRERLSTADNAVVRDALRKLVRGLKLGDRVRFLPLRAG